MSALDFDWKKWKWFWFTFTCNLTFVAKTRKIVRLFRLKGFGERKKFRYGRQTHSLFMKSDIREENLKILSPVFVSSSSWTVAKIKFSLKHLTVLCNYRLTTATKVFTSCNDKCIKSVEQTWMIFWLVGFNSWSMSLSGNKINETNLG